MNKVNLLFDISKLTMRPIPQQRDFEIEYYDFLKSLPEMINQAFEQTRAELKRKHPLSVNRNWFANTLNGNLIKIVADKYPNYIQKTKRGSFRLMMNLKYEGYIKKLTGRKLMPSYNHSKSSIALTHQRGIPKEDPLPVIFIGYTINKTNDRITGYHAVCIKGDERLWRTDLTYIEPPATMNITTDDIKQIHPVVSVKVKEHKKAK